MKYLLVLLLFAETFAHAQTRQEAIEFLVQNSSLRSLSCEGARTLVWRRETTGGRTRAYMYRFEPRTVKLVRGEFYDPQSGRTSRHPKLQCHAGRCIEHVESNSGLGLLTGKERDRDEMVVTGHSSVTVYEDSPPVDLERLIKAYDFLVESCGGPVKPSF